MKIAICTPYHGDVAADFAYSLGRMLLATVQTQIEFNGQIVHPQIELFFRTSSILPQLRNMLVQEALSWGANYLLFADSDHSFPEDALMRLLAPNLPVVGVNYPRRVAPHRPTATGLDGELVWTTEDDARSGLIVQVRSLGFGLCLIDRTVFETLYQHALATGADSIWPLFAMEMKGDGTGAVGEDVYFFRKLHAAGVPVYLDHSLSWAVGHVHQRVLTNAEAGR